MKKLIYLLAILIISFKASAQDCMSTSTNPVFVVDSFYFESPNNGIGSLVIDTTFTNNIWQTGTVQKAGFNSALSGSNALQTDTLNPYSINNESAAIVYINGPLQSFAPDYFSITFWHYYDTDTLADICKLEYSTDSGKTWTDTVKIFISNSPLMMNYYGSLNPVSGPTVLNWSGRSNGWQKESLCLMWAPFKGMQTPMQYAIRFVFQSDSVQTNKPGWMIDNIQIKNISSVNVKDQQKPGSITLSPNPTSNGMIRVSYPSNYINATIIFYNSLGQKVKQQPLSANIDISELKKGVYHYQIFCDDVGQRFSGTLLYD